MCHYDNKRNCAKEATPLGKSLLVAFVATLVGVVGAAAQGSAHNAQPKLVVGIVVEDLKTEYLSLLQEHLSQGGFNRLLRDGVVVTNADYGAPIDAAAATAVIYTGAAPAVNGIPAAEIFDRATLSGKPVFTDAGVMGNYTTQAFSPSALTVTTIADEVKVAGGGVTYAYAIAPSPEQAIIMAGHAGNCGMWLNHANESWATTTYYKDTPSTLNSRNRLMPLRTRIDTMTWAPMLSKEKYSLLPQHLTMYPFKYVFRSSGPEKMWQFTSSPKVNDEVTAFAIDNINQLKLGDHPGTDMISVAYTAQEFPYSKNPDNRYEVLDAYYRLDKNLETLLNAIDQKVGLNNAVVFVAATPPSQLARRDDPMWNLPYGEFSTRKALSLLNLYLIALYGNGDWAQGYHNGQVFLNHKLIEERGLNVENLRTESARFLQRMAGVNRAYTLDEIIDSRSAATNALRLNTAFGYAGDVLVDVAPGWQIIDDFNLNHPRTEQVVRATASTAPVFILAPGVTAREIDTPIDARAIAPTITSLLRIRSPNAAAVAPLGL